MFGYSINSLLLSRVSSVITRRPKQYTRQTKTICIIMYILYHRWARGEWGQAPHRIIWPVSP